MELFDKKFVHFMWDNELEGKEGFCADDICELINCVHSGNFHFTKVTKSLSPASPFKDTNNNDWLFFYFDPNYEVKRAFNEGKTIQYQLVGEVDWRDVGDEEEFKQYIEEGRQFRIKPEDKWIVFLARPDGLNSYLAACREIRWKTFQKSHGAKTKFFVGSEGEVREWLNSHQKFTQVIKSWEDGETIQYLDESTKQWMDIPKDYNIAWFVDREYRVKHECPCAVGIDSKACVGCEHSEDGKPRINKNYAEGACKDCLKRTKSRPYESSAEMITDFIDRFKVNCPTYCKPLIWVRLKVDKRERLIVAYGDNFVEIGNKTKAVTLQHLFEQYDFLDGSPVGMEAKND